VGPDDGEDAEGRRQRGGEHGPGEGGLGDGGPRHDEDDEEGQLTGGRFQ
jgi:hypothetical protein